MGILATTAFTLGVISYSAAATLFLLDLARRERAPLAFRWAPRLVAVAAALHALHITLVSLWTHTCPVGSVHFALSVAALVAVLGYLRLRRRPSLHSIGAIIAPTALVFLIASEFVGRGPPPGPVHRGLLTFHVTANLLGTSMFLLAATAGGLYLVQERRLREKRIAWGPNKLPPLDVLDTTLNRLLLVGFPLLTIGLVTGAVFASRVEYGRSAEVARAILAYATWVVVAAVLLFRRIAGWRGRRAAYGAIVGTLLILLVVALYMLAPTVGDGL